MADFDRHAALAAIKKAHDHVADLCEGKTKWMMRIPADEERDSDLVISAGLKAGEDAVGEIERVRDYWNAEFAELHAMYERLNAELVGRDKLLRRAFESGDDAWAVINRDESWDRWTR